MEVKVTIYLWPYVKAGLVMLAFSGVCGACMGAFFHAGMGKDNQ